MLGALQMTSYEQRFEEFEKDLIQLVIIEMMEISLMELGAKDDAAIVKYGNYDAQTAQVN